MSRFVRLPLEALHLILFRNRRCWTRHRRAVIQAVGLLPIPSPIIGGMPIVLNLRHIVRMPVDRP